MNLVGLDDNNKLTSADVYDANLSQSQADINQYTFRSNSSSAMFTELTSNKQISATTSYSRSFTITTHGRPVLIGLSGDMNPTNGTDWCRWYFYRDGTSLWGGTAQGSGASHNQTIGGTYLDIVAKGTYTYKIQITVHSGTMSFGESSTPYVPHAFCVEL